ncbi:MAG: hypothetical protein ACR2PZ_03900 [Pseudomonadales bacterium]
MTDNKSTYEALGQLVLEEVLIKGAVDLAGLEDARVVEVPMIFRIDVDAANGLLRIQTTRLGKPDFAINLHLGGQTVGSQILGSG